MTAAAEKDVAATLAEQNRVDGDLPVWSWGKPAYASLGAENSLWVAVLEKAWAFFRYETASYNSIEAGWMSEIYDAFGIRQDTNFSVITEQLLMEQMQADLLAGKSVTLATRNVPENSPLIDQHAYTVLSTELDGDGNVIPGLYAAGEMVGGLFYFNYPGGAGLTSAAVIGRLAARTAVTDAPAVTAPMPQAQSPASA